MYTEKSVLLLPFGLFTTQIPYVILGVIYLLYLGMAFLNRSELSEVPDFTTQNELAARIDFVETTSASDLPVVNISNKSISYPCHDNAESVSNTTITEFTFRQYGRQIARYETLTKIFETRNISFYLFSRPPPVTA